MKLLKSKYIIIIVLITIILFTQMVFILTEENKLVENYKTNILLDINSLTKVSIGNKMNVTRMLYNMLITEEVKEIMMNIYNDEEASKQLLREELYDLHMENYNFMTEIGVHQFQYHLPSTESFLRFHAPDKYGDILKDYRESVNKVIETGKVSHGYEEGRVFGGYRYVYPIMDQNKYVGSVEFSFEMDKIIKPVESTYDVFGILIMDGDEINKKSFSSVKRLYVKEEYTNLGYINSTKSHKDIISRLGVSEKLFVELSSKLGYEKENAGEDKVVFVYLKSSDTLLWAVSLPLIDVNGDIVGQLLYYKNDSTLFDLMENQDNVTRNSMVLMAASTVLIVMSVIFYANVRYKVTFDSLTKLYTRHAFYESVVGQIEDGVVLMIDIDNFKDINDKYGHFVGDEVLKNISSIIQGHIRSSDYAIRWGGEEFLVLFMQLDMDTAIKRARALVEMVEASEVNGVKATISIGVSMLTKNYERSFKIADDALYSAKSSGKNTVYVIKDE